MVVTTVTGKVANLSIDFSKEDGSVDKNGHPIYTSEEQIDAFINEDFEEVVETSADVLEVVATDMIIEYEKLKEDNKED